MINLNASRVIIQIITPPIAVKATIKAARNSVSVMIIHSQIRKREQPVSANSLSGAAL
jgi:hypothetical protein